MTFSIKYRGNVIKCDVVCFDTIHRMSIDIFAAYCTTDQGYDMWVYSYSRDMLSVFKAEVANTKYSLDIACNHVELVSYNSCTL